MTTRGCGSTVCWTGCQAVGRPRRPVCVQLTIPTSLRLFHHAVQGIAFVGPAVCMIACAILTPAAAATAKAATTGVSAAGPVLTAVLVGLMSVAFALGAWSRAGLYCNHQVRRWGAARAACVVRKQHVVCC